MRRSRPPRKTVGNIGSASCTVGLMSVPRPTPTPLTSTSTDMRRTRTPPRAEAEGVCKEGGRGPLALLAGSLDGAARPIPPSLPAHLMGCAAHTSLLAGSLDGLRGNTPSVLPADLPVSASAAQQLGQSRCEVVLVAHQLDHFRPRCHSAHQADIGPAQVKGLGNGQQGGLGRCTIHRPRSHTDDEDRPLTVRPVAVLPSDLGSGGSGLDPHAHSHPAIVPCQTRVLLRRNHRLRAPSTPFRWFRRNKTRVWHGTMAGCE